MSEQTPIETKRATCSHCGVCCGVLVDVAGDRPLAIRGDPDHPITKGFICKRGLAAIEYFDHPDRLDRPRKRLGGRGEGRWAELSWDEALDEIAERLRKIVDSNGPEAVAYAAGTFHGPDEQIGNRFLNHLGSPNSAGVWLICGGPQVEAEALTYGWGRSQPDLVPGTTRLVLLWGKHPSASSPPTWGRVLALKRAGAKLVTIDPRRTREAEASDLWLRPRPGSDAALALGFLHVIMSEGLYDGEFVKGWTVGFDELAARVKEYPPESVAQLTGVPVDDIVKAARMYATNRPAVISSSAPVGMGRNALNWERAMACLIAICGNLDVPGGNLLVGPPPDVLTKVDIDDYPALPPEQRAKRLGVDRFRLHNEGYERLNSAMRRVWSGRQYVLRADVGAAAHAPSLWRAILNEQPYPVRALFVQHNNVLGAYSNTQLAYQALKSPNLELLVVQEQFMTATAQLADYVLPAAGWLEKPFMYIRGLNDWMLANEQVVPARGERRSDYQLWADLASRMGLGGSWPTTLEGLFDMMVSPAGLSFDTLAQRPQNWLSYPKRYRHHEEIEPVGGKQLGFGTPTGKVELRSTILEELGYDPLPAFEEPLTPEFGSPEEYPFLLSTGATVIEMTHQDHRQIPSLRRQHPDPIVEISQEAAATLGIDIGDWIWIETPRGRVRQRAKISEGLHPEVVVAERWWYPERRGEEPELYGIWESNINAYTEDDPELCDLAYGSWPFRLGRCRISKA